MGQADDRSYEVGKGKPPREHQFKKGQSGNPRGRRRQRSPDGPLSETLAALLQEPVEVTQGGKATKMTTRDAILRRLVLDAINGTPVQRRKAVETLRDLGAFDAASGPLDHSIPQDRIDAVVAMLAAEQHETDKAKQELRASGLSSMIDDPVG